MKKFNTLNKNITIKELMVRLSGVLGQDFFDIVDHWVDDEASIGIANPQNHQVLIYISCYGQEEGFYDVHLELPPSGKSDQPFTDAGKFSSVNFDKLTEITRNHLQ